MNFIKNSMDFLSKNILKIIYKANRRLRLSISMLMMVIVA